MDVTAIMLIDSETRKKIKSFYPETFNSMKISILLKENELRTEEEIEKPNYV